MTCPMFGALMDVLYPQHIFGLYEEQCNITDVTQTTGKLANTAASLMACRLYKNWPRKPQNQ